ncbi:hypothetical protein ACEWY4_025230 [Coilia grayii]|uniref:B30.2/SPRY domain-containing protein n=1 Tax=Coilia grayii TaxID=363190 RepID=A0ABD1IYQ8_9TELE
MSEDISEDPDPCDTTRPASNTTEKIYMNEVPKRSQRKAGHCNSQDNSGGHHCCCKLAVVLVCVLLLAVTIALRITTLNFSRAEKAQVKIQYNNLNADKNHLEERNANLTHDKSQLEAELSAMTGERDELQRRLSELGEYSLEEKNANLTHDKSQPETELSAMTGERDELQRRLSELESHDMKTIKQHAVDVTLDPDTANPYLILSADGKQVKHGDTRQNVPDTPKRFNRYSIVLGKEGFSSGKFYYEVQVKGKIRWDIGVAKESINRKGQISLSPNSGYWVIWLKDGTYEALAGSSVPLSLKGKPQRVGVFVDYDAGLVSFYDADCWHDIYSFTNVSFTEKIYPFFSPGLNHGGRNSAPLIISPD